jgi:hypothetical protein
VTYIKGGVSDDRIPSRQRRVAAALTAQISQSSNCWVEPELPEVISGGSRRISGRTAWPIAVVLLTGALLAAIALTVHYHGEDVALLHRLRTPPKSHPAGIALPMLASSTVALPADRTLNGAVTVISAKSSTGQARIVLSAYIAGGAPDTTYTLIAFDCTGRSGYQSWATGRTDGRGVGLLTGQSWPVFMNDKFWLYLSRSSSGASGPGLLGTFSAAGTFSASVAGNPACH